MIFIESEVIESIFLIKYDHNWWRILYLFIETNTIIIISSAIFCCAFGFRLSVKYSF